MAPASKGALLNMHYYYCCYETEWLYLGHNKSLWLLHYSNLIIVLARKKTETEIILVLAILYSPWPWVNDHYLNSTGTVKCVIWNLWKVLLSKK